MHHPNIKNIIFDLGGVILDLSVDHTLESFAKLSGLTKDEVHRIFVSSPGFLAYEKGYLTDEAFRDFVREIYVPGVSDEQIDVCWNAMLRAIPIAKLQLLETLKQRYSVYLLSNTNGIHLSYINCIMLPETCGTNSLDPYFHRTYYSHLMGKRKPDKEIFEQVLEENSLQAGQTLFLDDNHANILGAEVLGIKTFYVKTPEAVFDYFHE